MFDPQYKVAAASLPGLKQSLSSFAAFPSLWNISFFWSSQNVHCCKSVLCLMAINQNFLSTHELIHAASKFGIYVCVGDFLVCFRCSHWCWHFCCVLPLLFFLVLAKKIRTYNEKLSMSRSLTLFGFFLNLLLKLLKFLLITNLWLGRFVKPKLNWIKLCRIVRSTC